MTMPRTASEIAPVLAFFGCENVFTVAMWDEDQIEDLFRLKGTLEDASMPGPSFLDTLATALTPKPTSKPTPKPRPDDFARQLAKYLRVAAGTIEKLGEAEAQAEGLPRATRRRRTRKGVTVTDAQRDEARELLRKLGGRGR
jgi:hypothetical protein